MAKTSWYSTGCLKFLLIFQLSLTCLLSFGQLIPNSVVTPQGSIGFYEFRPQGYNPDSSYNYPLIIFLHGVGERGNGTSELPLAHAHGLPFQIFNGATMKFLVNGRQYAFIVLIPQMSKEYFNWQNFYVDAMLDYAKRNLRIDTNKIFLTGWSLGGGGAWKYATSSLNNAKKIAGIIMAAGSPDYTDLCNLAKGNVAVWAYHALDDASVPLHFTKDAIDGINACHPVIPALHSFYPFGGHPLIAKAAYDTSNEYQYPNMFQWMIGTTKHNLLIKNQPPVALAGRDTSITVPTLSTLLNGEASYDPNDVIVHYRWTKLSGPPSTDFSIDKPDFPVTTVSGLELGKYSFRLTVTDEFGVTRSDTMQLLVRMPSRNVNAAPFINFIPDIKTSAKNYHISCTARDFDGAIKGFHWRQISGPARLRFFSYNNASDVYGLTLPGTYRVEVTAYDDHIPAGLSRDTVCITKITRSRYVTPYFANTPGNLRHLRLPSGIVMGAVLLIISFPVILFSWSDRLPEVFSNWGNHEVARML